MLPNTNRFLQNVKAILVTSIAKYFMAELPKIRNMLILAYRSNKYHY